MSSDISQSAEDRQDLDTADTLKPTFLPLPDQLTYLESDTCNPIIVHARLTIATNLNRYCRFMLDHAKKKLELEKTSHETKEQYSLMLTQPGVHVNDLKKLREKTENDRRQAEVLSQYINDILQESKPARMRVWTQLIELETKTNSAPKDNKTLGNDTSRLETERLLKATIKSIRGYLAELKLHNIDIDSPQ